MRERAARKCPAPETLELGTTGGWKTRYRRRAGPLTAHRAYGVSRMRRQRGERGMKVIRFEDGYYLYYKVEGASRH